MPFRAFSVFVRIGEYELPDGSHIGLNALSGIQCIRTSRSTRRPLNGRSWVLMPFRAFSVFVPA